MGALILFEYLWTWYLQHEGWWNIMEEDDFHGFDYFSSTSYNGRVSSLKGLTLLKSLSLCVYVGRFLHGNWFQSMERWGMSYQCSCLKAWWTSIVLGSAHSLNCRIFCWPSLCILGGFFLLVSFLIGDGILI